MEKCANCDVTIGNLETPFLWDGRVVCHDCYQRLSKMNSEQVEDVAAQIRADLGQPLPYAGPATPPRTQRSIPAPNAVICPNPNCGYRGPPQMKSRTNIGISLILIVLWLLFGFLSAGTRDSGMWIASIACFLGWLGYTIFTHGKARHCPRCGIGVE